MKLDDVMPICDEVLEALPAAQNDALEHVDIVVVENETSKELEGLKYELGFRGLYVGTQLDDADDEGDEADKPIGAIYICAANIEDREDVERVLLHEIGHALGLSEDEVENLNLE